MMDDNNSLGGGVAEGRLKKVERAREREASHFGGRDLP